MRKYMWQKIKDAFYFITRSSSNPVQMSLLVRGVLVGIVGIVVQVVPVACLYVAALCIDSSQLNGLVDGITNFVRLGLELVAVGMVIVGALRKIYYGRLVHPAAGEVE